MTWTNSPTLPETNISAPENGWLEDDPFLLGCLPDRCELLVSGSVFFLVGAQRPHLTLKKTNVPGSKLPSFLHIIGNKLINPIVGVYIPINYKVKGGMSLSPKKHATFDHCSNVTNRAPSSTAKLHVHTWHLRNDHDLVDSVHVSVLGGQSCGKTGKDAEKSMKVKMDLAISKAETETPNASLFLPKQEETASDLGWNSWGGFPSFFTYSFRPDLDTRLKSGVDFFDVKSGWKAWQDGAFWGNLLYFRNVLGGDSKLLQHLWPTHIHLSFGNAFWIPLGL